MRFHINPITGKSSRCSAKQKCPFGDLKTDHYSTLQEAQEAYEIRMNQTTLPAPKNPRKLKAMDSPELATQFIELAKKSGFNAQELEETLNFASVLHGGQTRMNRGSHNRTPYIEHPLRVAFRLLRLGVRDPAVIKAALLHDTVEDCSIKFVKIFQGQGSFSPKIARKQLASHIEDKYGTETKEIVLSVTNELRDSKPSINERHRIYKENLEKKIVDNPPALLVKYSDFMDNAGGLHHNDLPGNESRVFRMASKYQPCVQIFTQEFNKESPLIDTSNREDCLLKLEATNGRLLHIIKKHSAVS